MEVQKAGAVCVVLGAVVIDVEVAACSPRRRIQVHSDGEWVLLRAGAAPPDARLQGHDGPGPVEGRDPLHVNSQRVPAGMEEGPRVEVVPPAVAPAGMLLLYPLRLHGQVHRCACQHLFHRLANAPDQHCVPQHDLILHGVLVALRRHVRQEVPEEWPHNWLALRGVLLEQGVPQRQHLVPELQGSLHQLHGALVVDVRLPAWRLQVGMVPQERVREDSQLVPAGDHLRIGVLEEATDVRTHQRLPRHGQRPDHGDRRLEVLPLRVVVARPDGRVPVRADEEGPGQHERPVALHALGEAFEGRAVHVVAVHVVQVAVLNAALDASASVGVDGVAGTGHLGAVEHGGLVHVVPDVQVRVGAVVLVEGELRAPVLSHPRVWEVRIPRRAGPAPPLEVLERRVGILYLSRLPHALVLGIVDLWGIPLAVVLLAPALWNHGIGVGDLRLRLV
mmetsp:Transcript_20237/g.54117  ORF Transcript_20237/g.54117 Transcript_20237/m.54117 type:complete len:448 (+) Transcript_20237:632-1975(+)